MQESFTIYNLILPVINYAVLTKKLLFIFKEPKFKDGV